MKSVRKALLGRKLGMTQLFAEDGNAVAVTVIAAGPCTVVQRKTTAKEGYEALQLGFEELENAKRLTKPAAGHFAAAAKKSGKPIPSFRHLVEVKLGEPEAYQVGDTIAADVFAVGDEVNVIGTSKGKGFAGGQKRHGFKGGPATHGSMSHRRPASGGATDAARVFKGVKKPGHMGSGAPHPARTPGVDGGCGAPPAGGEGRGPRPQRRAGARDPEPRPRGEGR